LNNSNFIFGIRPVIEAIKAGKEIDKILIQNNLHSEAFRELNTLIKDLQLPSQYVPIEKLNRLTQKNHQGIICFIAPVEYHRIENIIPSVYEAGKVPFILILDKITDVRNIGAIIRSAECAGVQAIIIPSKGSAQLNADAIKASAGALHKVPICRTESLKETIEYLKNSGLQIISCTEKATKYFYSIKYIQPSAIIMGSEESGISSEYIKLSDHHVKIPMLGEIESLNVSVATGIILFEAVKQRLS
jgi:23S rRNA (guanosine2251-2'-O)-methyltransferase